MTLDTSYQNQYPFLFSENAGTVTASGLSEGDRVSVKITQIDGTALSFSAIADEDGRVVIDLAAILSSMKQLFTISPALAWTMLTFKFITATTGGRQLITKEWKVMAGGSTTTFIKEIYENRRFISARPQTYPIDTEKKEYLFLYSAETPSVKARVYTDIAYLSGLEISLEASSVFFMWQVIVSYAAVRKSLDDGGYEDHKILAFDVFSEDSDGVKSESLRFTVDYDKRDAFQFIGSLGTGETLFARGARKSEVDSETASFINGDVEQELSNDSKVIHESFTGNLASAEEVRYWHEFFASPERYAFTGSSTYRRIIIDDIDTEGTEGELAAFSFKWHYADRDDDPARVPARTGLKPYGADALWYETAAEADKTVLKSGLKGVKVSGGSGEHILPQDGDGYANLEIGSPLTYGGDGMGVVWENEL